MKRGSFFLLRPRMLPLGDLPKIGSRTWTRWASCEAGESAYNPQRAATSRSMLAHWQATHNKHSHYALLRCALLVACLLRRMVRDRKRAAFVVTVFLVRFVESLEESVLLVSIVLVRLGLW